MGLSREEKILQGKERLNEFRSKRITGNRTALADISNVGKVETVRDTPKKSARPDPRWASPHSTVTEVLPSARMRP
jgi:hypothetical protein